MGEGCRLKGAFISLSESGNEPVRFTSACLPQVLRVPDAAHPPSPSLSGKAPDGLPLSSQGVLMSDLGPLYQEVVCAAVASTALGGLSKTAGGRSPGSEGWHLPQSQ